MQAIMSCVIWLLPLCRVLVLWGLPCAQVTSSSRLAFDLLVCELQIESRF